MKLRKLIRRTAAAAVVSAMALSLCMPALADIGSLQAAHTAVYAQNAAESVQDKAAASYGITVTIDNTNYVVTADNYQNIYSTEKYSLQGTTQSRYLTGGVPPVRFSM